MWVKREKMWNKAVCLVSTMNSAGTLVKLSARIWSPAEIRSLTASVGIIPLNSTSKGTPFFWCPFILVLFFIFMHIIIVSTLKEWILWTRNNLNNFLRKSLVHCMALVYVPSLKNVMEFIVFVLVGQGIAVDNSRQSPYGALLNFYTFLKPL